MGECGCGDLQPHKVLKVGDKLLIVEVYDGCHYCDTPIGVALHLATPEWAKDWGIEADGTLEPDEYGWAEIAFPLIDPQGLIEAAREVDADDAVGEGGYGCFTEWLKDEGLTLLQKALANTMTRYGHQPKGTIGPEVSE